MWVLFALTLWCELRILSAKVKKKFVMWNSKRPIICIYIFVVSFKRRYINLFAIHIKNNFLLLTYLIFYWIVLKKNILFTFVKLYYSYKKIKFSQYAFELDIDTVFKENCSISIRLRLILHTRWYLNIIKRTLIYFKACI